MGIKSYLHQTGGKHWCSTASDPKVVGLDPIHTYGFFYSKKCICATDQYY